MSATTTVRPLKACAVCGTKSTGNWCSTLCHRLDEPGAYEPDNDYGDDE